LGEPYRKVLNYRLEHLGEPYRKVLNYRQEHLGETYRKVLYLGEVEHAFAYLLLRDPLQTVVVIIFSHAR
jgi:hypothetical protein